jgi:hypothetical protein
MVSQNDQKIYEIVYTGNKAYYNVTVDGKRIAEAITEISEISVAVFCDYTGTPKDELFIDDTEVLKPGYVKIIANLNSMFVGVKMRRSLEGYKFCGLSIDGQINESIRSAAI